MATIDQPNQSTQDKNLLLTSSKVSHHMMKIKHPNTELKRVVLPCLEIAADLIHVSEKEVNKIKKILLSDITVA